MFHHESLIQVMDTVYLMTGIARSAEAAWTHLVLCGELSVALTSDMKPESIRIDCNDVRWRSSAHDDAEMPRPWMVGVLRKSMLLILDAQSLVESSLGRNQG